MVKYRPHVWFIGIMLCYFVVKYLRQTGMELPSFIRYYLTDLFFVPAMCLFALIGVRTIKGDSTLKISSILVFAQVAIVSLFFEWYLPNFSEKTALGWYVQDIYDVVMYFLGGILYLLIQKKL